MKFISLKCTICQINNNACLYILIAISLFTPNLNRGSKFHIGTFKHQTHFYTGLTCIMIPVFLMELRFTITCIIVIGKFPI